jgi:hypothetical protein
MGYTFMLKYFKECNKVAIKYNYESADLAAENGHIDTLIYLKQEENILCTYIGANGAAKNGHIDIIM